MSKLSSEEILNDFINHKFIKSSDAKDYKRILKFRKYISIEFDIESRLDLINLAIKKTNAKSYLEIGCDKDEVFSQIDVESKIGVDPTKGGTHRMTSDQFFITNNKTFDVIFIDGLHYYEQLHRDIINSLKYLNKTGIIIIHDLLPISKKQVQVPGPTNWYPGWLGDAYKVNFDLTNNPFFDFRIVKTDLGCGIICNVNNNKIDIPKLNTDYEHYTNNVYNLSLVSFEEIKKILS